MKGKTVHVVLLVLGGIPEDPELFENSAEAMNRFREMAKYHLDLDGAQPDDMTDDELFQTIADREDDDNDLYLYETEVK